MAPYLWLLTFLFYHKKIVKNNYVSKNKTKIISLTTIILFRKKYLAPQKQAINTHGSFDLFLFTFKFSPPFHQISPWVSENIFFRLIKNLRQVLGTAGLPLASSNSSPPISAIPAFYPHHCPGCTVVTDDTVAESSNCQFSLYSVCFQYLTVNHPLV